jgi:hypothetical protein
MARVMVRLPRKSIRAGCLTGIASTGIRGPAGDDRQHLHRCGRDCGPNGLVPRPRLARRWLLGNRKPEKFSVRIGDPLTPGGPTRHIEHAEASTPLGRLGCGGFLRVGNDSIQPLEKSASRSLIRNDRFCDACGLQDFDAWRGGEKKAPERVEWGIEWATTPSHEVRRLPQKPPQFRGTKEKGQPRTVDPWTLVEEHGIEPQTASPP